MAQPLEASIMWISETTTDSPGVIKGMASGERSVGRGVANAVGVLGVHGVAVAIGAAVESLVGVGVLSSQRVAVGALLLGVGVGTVPELPGPGVEMPSGSGAAPEQAPSHRETARRARCHGKEL
jgi:hypothetical protein